MPPAANDAATAAQQGEPEACAAGAAGTAEAHAGGAAAGPVLQSINSGETVQQPTLYNAMLDHLRGPQYASPARFAVPQRADSPQSPQQCTPLHLISTSDTSPPTGAPAWCSSLQTEACQTAPESACMCAEVVGVPCCAAC